MIKWKRPSGSFIETANTPELIEYGKANGWTLVDEPKEKPKPSGKEVKNDNSKAVSRGSGGKDRGKDS